MFSDHFLDRANRKKSLCKLGQLLCRFTTANWVAVSFLSSWVINDHCTSLFHYFLKFDALVEKLTGREMLEMYAHLRGVPDNKIKDLVTHTIDSLNLGKWADKMCGTYR